MAARSYQLSAVSGQQEIKDQSGFFTNPESCLSLRVIHPPERRGGSERNIQKVCAKHYPATPMPRMFFHEVDT